MLRFHFYSLFSAEKEGMELLKIDEEDLSHFDKNLK